MLSRLPPLLLAGLLLAACDTAEPEPDPSPSIEGVYFTHEKSDDGVWTTVGRLELTQSGTDLTGDIELVTRGPLFSGQEYNRVAGTYAPPRLRLDVLPQTREIRGVVSEDGYALALEVEYWHLNDAGTTELRVREMVFERPRPYTPPDVLPVLSGTYVGTNSEHGTEEQGVLTLAEGAGGAVSGTADAAVLRLNGLTEVPVSGEHAHPGLVLYRGSEHPNQRPLFIGTVSADGATITGRFGAEWYWPTYVLTRTE